MNTLQYNLYSNVVVGYSSHGDGKCLCGWNRAATVAFTAVGSPSGEEHWAAAAVGCFLPFRVLLMLTRQKATTLISGLKKKKKTYLVLNPVHLLLISFCVSCHFYLRFPQILCFYPAQGWQICDASARSDNSFVFFLCLKLFAESEQLKCSFII